MNLNEMCLLGFILFQYVLSEGTCIISRMICHNAFGLEIIFLCAPKGGPVSTALFEDKNPA